jgi:hypothetical protein
MIGNLPAPRTLGLLATAVMLCVSVRSAEAEDDAQALARLRKEMAEAIGAAACGSVSACRLLPMGSDACGNPTVWVPFNNAEGLRIIVETKAAEYTFIEEDQYRGKPRPVGCKAAVAPKLACVNKRCVLGEASY